MSTATTAEGVFAAPAPGHVAGVGERPSEDALTIDELTASSGVPSRTIRFYQSKGVLPAPQKHGRVAYYFRDHAERLQLIAQLQDRGLRINAIRTLLARIDSGEVDLGEWLGLEEQLTAPWADDQPRTVNAAELAEITGEPRVGLIADLIRIGALERTGEVFMLKSPALLQIALRLERMGMDLDTTWAAEKVMRKAIQRAAKDLASLFVNEAKKGHIEPPPDGDWSRMLAELRPTAIDAVRIIFGQEMERVLREMVESGQTAKLGDRPRKRRR